MSDLSTFTRHLANYLSPADLRRVEAAYRYSEKAHAGQTRASGEPYISHPLAVASILSDWRFDADGLIAALLHDVIEDTPVAKTEIASHFGEVVAHLVDGVSKLDQVRLASSEDRQAESLRKMFAAMDSDVRVMLIKLADRLHNMRTLDFLPLEKRKRVSQETLDIYAAIAARLGLNSLAKELQDASFKHLHPRRYHIIQKALRASRSQRHDWLHEASVSMETELAKHGVNATVSQREKSVYGIYRKMQEKGNQYSAVSDTFGVRIVVDSIRDCYVALGVLHAMYKPRLEQFKDYIAIPKNNGYQSLHTTVFMPNGTSVEMQIRTMEMHRRAEIGVAAHWLYKQTEDSGADENQAHDRAQADAAKSLSSLLEIEKLSGDAREFLESVKSDLIPEEIYVFTPRGKLLPLPRGATSLDFAYAVHTEIGSRAVASVVNGDQQPLYHALHNGDRVEIVTDTHAHPTPAWLGFAHTARAKGRIRHYLRTMREHESAELGERLLKQAVATLAGDWAAIEPSRWDATLRAVEARNKTELCSMVGSGRRLAFPVASQLLALNWQAEESAAKPRATVLLNSSESAAIRYARCCQPVPGDSIVGLFRKSVGLEIHVHHCAQTRSKPLLMDAVEWVDVAWGNDVTGEFLATVRVTVDDQKGVLAKMAQTIADADANIESVYIDPPAPHAKLGVTTFQLRVKHLAHLAHVIRDLRILPVVRRALRVRSARSLLARAQPDAAD
jgi:GTP diphosphokinase / guanosine-3',5'-bis(diphosphate) 3'-diphosphatase